jgi:alkylation response protein AidB-like acyl-CoA dehydrogenase
VPCARPAWVAIITPSGVDLAGDFSASDIDRPTLGLRAAGASAITLRGECEPIGDAAEAARWLVELRVLAAASMLGAARDAAEYARTYAKDRIAFGKPIAHHQGLAFTLVETATDLDAAGLLLATAASSEAPDVVAAAHAFVTRTALRVVERSLQALGGHGYLYDHPVEKRMRDVRALASLFGGVVTADRDATDRVLALRDPLELR